MQDKETDNLVRKARKRDPDAFTEMAYYIINKDHIHREELQI